MKFYYIAPRHADKIPIELYKDKVIILAHRCTSHSREFAIEYFEVILDYTYHRKIKFSKLVLHKLTLEDFTHLNLMGIPISPAHGVYNKELAKAIKLKRKSYRGSLGNLVSH